MKKIISLIAVLAMLGPYTTYAKDFAPLSDIEKIDVTGVEIPSVGDCLNLDVLDIAGGVSLFQTSVNPVVSDIEKATLSGDVEGGEISPDGKSISFDNGESVSVYTLTVNPGDYGINGLCLSCTSGADSMYEDITFANITGDVTVKINMVVNRADATIRVAALKENGRDAYHANGVKYRYEIIEGDASDWVLTDNGHTIEQYVGEYTDNLVIPNMIDGKSIFMVQNQTLISERKVGTIFGEYNSSMTEKAGSVKISEGILGIGAYAFTGCDDLAGEITIPASVQIVGPYAFYDCSQLTGSLDLSNLNALYPYSFYGCSSLGGELVLPDVTVIPDAVFAGCPLSGDLVIPDTVKSIGYYAFALNGSGIDGLTSITLPASLETIGAVAFQYRDNAENELILPDGLVHIGDFAFNHCRSFSNTSVILPSSVTTIGGDLNVTSNTGYGGHVFYDSFLDSLEFTVNEGSEAFKASDGVLMSKNGKRIISYPLAKTDTEYVIPDGVVQIDEMAFGKSMVKDITLPDSFVISTQVPENIINNNANTLAVALYVDNSCENIFVKETNNNYTSLDGVLYSKDKSTLWYMPVNRTEFAVAEECTTIKNGAVYCRAGAFSGKSLSIPASVTVIEANALAAINASGANISVDSNNAVYKVTGGKIVLK